MKTAIVIQEKYVGKNAPNPFHHYRRALDMGFVYLEKHREFVLLIEDVLEEGETLQKVLELVDHPGYAESCDYRQYRLLLEAQLEKAESVC